MRLQRSVIAFSILECRQLQEKLVGNQPLTPERAEEIAETMNRSGCTARFPAS
jgi:hypothetical protein